MKTRTRRTVLMALSLALPCLIAFSAFVYAYAAAPSQNTVITVGEMCGGCVKSITARLNKLPDIAAVQCDIKTKTVTVVPRDGKSLSPRTLWEAMAEIGKTPKKLVAPAGSFTSKPQG